MTDHPFVSIEGGIAAGKSTTGKFVANQLGWTFLTEDFKSNPILETFYTDPPRYAVEAELGFYAIHYHQLSSHRDTRPLLTDFSLINNLSFCRMLMDDRSFKLFEDLAVRLSALVGDPDLAIYLDVPPAAQLKRLRERGRPMEQSVTEQYLSQLRDAYLHCRAKLGHEVTVIEIGPAEDEAAVAEKVTALVEARFPDVRKP